MFVVYSRPGSSRTVSLIATQSLNHSAHMHTYKSPVQVLDHSALRSTRSSKSRSCSTATHVHSDCQITQLYYSHFQSGTRCLYTTTLVNCYKVMRPQIASRIRFTYGLKGIWSRANTSVLGSLNWLLDSVISAMVNPTVPLRSQSKNANKPQYPECFLMSDQQQNVPWLGEVKSIQNVSHWDQIVP